jgi:hypothetical protein
MDTADRSSPTVPAPSSDLGRHVFGAAVLAFGLIALVWHDVHDWDAPRFLSNAAAAAVFFYAVALAQVFGGIAMQFRQTAKAGAAVLAAVYLIFAFLVVPKIVAAPQVYNTWGNFFEVFSLATGAALVYARFSSAWAPETLVRSGRVLFGICVVSFTLEQAFYLENTAILVPKWLPPSQMYWAVTTTDCFALAAVALLANRAAFLATRLLTLMLVMFGLLVWVPLLLSSPRNHTNWSEFALTFEIAGAAWILADLLGAYRRRAGPPSSERPGSTRDG